MIDCQSVDSKPAPLKTLNHAHRFVEHACQVLLDSQLEQQTTPALVTVFRCLDIVHNGCPILEIWADIRGKVLSQYVSQQADHILLRAILSFFCNEKKQELLII